MGFVCWQSESEAQALMDNAIPIAYWGMAMGAAQICTMQTRDLCAVCNIATTTWLYALYGARRERKEKPPKGAEGALIPDETHPLEPDAPDSAVGAGLTSCS